MNRFTRSEWFVPIAIVAPATLVLLYSFSIPAKVKKPTSPTHTEQRDPDTQSERIVRVQLGHIQEAVDDYREQLARMQKIPGEAAAENARQIEENLSIAIQRKAELLRIQHDLESDRD